MQSLDMFTKITNNIVILGKGPTLELYKPENHTNDFVIGINDVVDVYDCNMLVANDYDTFLRLNKARYNKLQCVLSPVIPHVDMRPGNKTFKDTLKLCGNFSGAFIPYNLLTSGIIYKQFIVLQSMVTSGNTAIEFADKFARNAKSIQCYGIGIENKPKYCSLFSKTTGAGYDSYTPRILNLIRNAVKTTISIKYN